MINKIACFCLCCLLVFSLFYQCSLLAQKKQNVNKIKSISLTDFQDSAHHWYDINEEEKIITPSVKQKKYKPEQVNMIADNILLFQKENGGWPKNYDMKAILTEEQKEQVKKAKNRNSESTIDNGATHSHIEYLAKAYKFTKDEKYKDACIKGIDYVLSAQYPNGGWPQFYPDTSGYRKYITFNDGAMIGCMKVLKKIVDAKPEYSFVDDNLKKIVKDAYTKGIDCILKCQIKEEGKLTVWCQQHDQIDLRPQKARAFEMAAICNGESADIVMFLMDIINPSEEIVNSINSAVKWFQDQNLKGIKVVKVKAKGESYMYHKADFDKIVVNDPSAPRIWPRYSELGTHKPLFCNRDSKPVYSLAEVARERRTGYGWYTYDPENVLKKYPAWKKKWNEL